MFTCLCIDLPTAYEGTHMGGMYRRCSTSSFVIGQAETPQSLNIVVVPFASLDVRLRFLRIWACRCFATPVLGMLLLDFVIAKFPPPRPKPFWRVEPSGFRIRSAHCPVRFHDWRGRLKRTTLKAVCHHSYTDSEPTGKGSDSSGILTIGGHRKDDCELVES